MAPEIVQGGPINYGFYKFIIIFDYYLQFTQLSKFQFGEDYCGLKSRRAKQEYGRDELYKWLGKYKMVEDRMNNKHAVGVVRKNAESSVNL